jgi:hypothetical protein
MKLPIRPREHVIESTSFKIFERWVPDHWLLRQVTERDYGIDAYVELVKLNGEVTGDLISIQLKGTEKAFTDNLKAGKHLFTGTEIETVNYWNNLQIPIFLFLIDIKNEVLAFANVKKHVRKNYAAFQTQKTFSFEMTLANSSLGISCLPLFFAEYFKEKEYRQFTEYARTLIIHWQYYLDFLQEEVGRDCFLPVEAPEVFFHIYKTLRHMAEICGVKWTAAEIAEILAFDRQFKDEYYILHAATMDKYVPEVEKMFFEIIQKIRTIITVEEQDYWKTSELLLFKKAFYFDHITFENGHCKVNGPF